MRGQPIGEIIRVLNPIIRGYGQYWKHVVSKKILVQWIAISIGESANIFDSSIQRSRGNGYMQDITGIHIMVEMLGHQPA